MCVVSSIQVDWMRICGDMWCATEWTGVLGGPHSGGEVCVWLCTARWTGAADTSVLCTPTAAQGRVTSLWCGGETRGGGLLG